VLLRGAAGLLAHFTQKKHFALVLQEFFLDACVLVELKKRNLFIVCCSSRPGQEIF
jgi:hypothetical protein